MTEYVTTYRLRLKSKYSSELCKKARAVNVVWNYCNETQMKAVKSCRKWLSGFDLVNLTSGSCHLLPISSRTINEVCLAYTKSRRGKNKAWLKFRSKKSLGWVPFKNLEIKIKDGGCVSVWGRVFSTMHSRDFPDDITICAGSFSQDSRGNWYINITFKASAKKERIYSRAVGIDLGLKDLATTSDGATIPAMQFYRKSEAALATSQRARKTKRARAISRKVANRRKDFLHKQANALVKEYGTIIVGDVSPSKLTKTRMAKSVNDASWATFKGMLRYKSVMNGGRMIEVNEAYTTQTCSECGSRPAQRPRGIAGLGIREWSCGDCGAVHNRDVNAARNILRIGLDTLAEGVVA